MGNAWHPLAPAARAVPADPCRRWHPHGKPADGDDGTWPPAGTRFAHTAARMPRKAGTAGTAGYLTSATVIFCSFESLRSPSWARRFAWATSMRSKKLRTSRPLAKVSSRSS